MGDLHFFEKARHAGFPTASQQPLLPVGLAFCSKRVRNSDAGRPWTSKVNCPVAIPIVSIENRTVKAVELSLALLRAGLQTACYHLPTKDLVSPR